MLEALRQELARCAAQIRRRDKVTAMLGQRRAEQEALRQQETALREILEREKSDVERLERTSAAALLYTILGKKEERLDKEQQEFYAARLKYSVAARQLADCTGDMEALERELASLSGCQAAYDKVFQEIQSLLRDDPAYGERVCGLEEALGRADSQLRELDEAIAAGNAAVEQVQRIGESLDSASGWGTWDLFGGGVLSDLAKYSCLDDAQAGVEDLQRLLDRFRTELADVSLSADLEPVNVDGFLQFADFFFDGLIADWAVLSRIEDAQDRMARLQEQLRLALTRLLDLRFAQAADRAALEAQLCQLVTAL